MTSLRAVSPLGLVGAGLALVMLGGCSDDAGPGPVAATLGTARPAPARAQAQVPTCRVTTTVTRVEARVLYSHTIGDEASGIRSGSADATLAAYPPLDPGVRVDRPRGASLDTGTRDAVLAQVVGSTLLDGVRGLSWRVAGPGRFLVYAGAAVRHGTWVADHCGTAATERGSFLTIGRIRTGVVPCRATHGPGGASPSALRSVAARAACRPPPQSYRQFHDPTA